MQSYAFGHLSNDAAWSTYQAAESREAADTAMTLALLAEVDERRLYLPAGYGSMCDFCMQARHMSRARALKRIRVARAGREFPAIFAAIADGRLGLSAVLLLAPHLKPETAEELITVASHKTTEEIEQLLAGRSGQAAPQMLLQPTESEAADDSVAARLPVPCNEPNEAMLMEPVSVATTVKHSAWRYAFSAAREEKLRYVQSLLAHSKPSASVDQLLDLALDCLQDKLERQKFGKCSRPGKARGSDNPRYIPDEVKRAVWKRDDGKCTFVGTGGKRCDSRDSVEFDHVEAVSRGGGATVGNIRLLCRAHNQYEAEQTYGTDFMRGKREQARERAAAAKAQREAKEAARAASAAKKARAEKIIPWLRELGYNLQRAKRGVELTMHMLDAPIEERMKVALRGLAPKCLRISPDGTKSFGAPA